MSTIETGARALGIGLHPHQLQLGAMLDEGVEVTAIQWPRRAGKTTSVWAWLIGYAMENPDTLIASTAQSRIKARARWSEFAGLLRKGSECPHVRESIGSEQFEWSNGSRLWIVPPKPGAFRSDAADVVYVDEPQELHPDASVELEQAVMPMLDTREPGQVILSGTPGFIRAGWFWDALEAGRAGEPGHMASIYAAADFDDVDDEAVWLRIHKGIGTLTTLQKMRARHAGFARKDPQKWAMEYMGIWPGSKDGRALSAEDWEACGLDDFAERPERFALSFDVSPDGSRASLLATWRDDDEVVWWELLAHGDTRTIGREALRLSRKYRVPIAYDAIGANLEVAEALQRARPAPKLMPMTMRDMMTGAAMTDKLVKRRELRHARQPTLDEAAEGVAWRDVGDNGRLFGRRASAGDVSSIVAGSAGIVAFDRMPKRATLRTVTRVAS